MTGMEIVNPRLDRFVERLRANLGTPKNVAKGDWRDMSYYELLTRLRDELAELQEEIDHGPQGSIVMEACDVAAFAFMIADKAAERRG